ncbi:MAG TPA: cellulase family glycosylhydrolase, partial [Nevskiaceae bacterium]|nr:cellulase family glycosylhydrolase [Nevskiaceae bacterium]
MSPLWVNIRGNRFVDANGRQLILRGVNLGGDGKLPYPDGGTDRPGDFSDHATVSFVGRPFPLAQADEHLGRIAGWGFNLLRLVVTWEAVEHAGPWRYDTDYIEYIGAVCERAAAYGLAVFIDFHQDVWSRMSGGSGAPCWIFDALGLDYRRFGEADAAHVMQYRYDYRDPRRLQEERYPTMSWPVNYRMAVNGIVWTAFFGGRTFTPQWMLDGVNVQDFLQDHYLGALRALAQRVRELPNVIGFDSLNEPGQGWIGRAMTQRAGIGASGNFRGPAWTPLDGLAIASGLPRSVPFLVPNEAKTKIIGRRDVLMNKHEISIWKDGVADPYAQAGAWSLEHGEPRAADEDFFRKRDGRAFDIERDFMAPFFARVAQAMRSVRADWLLFAEINPHVLVEGRTFPQQMPDRSVNANHWYDVNLLMGKTYPVQMSAAERAQMRKGYAFQLSYLKLMGDRLGGGAPTLVGEFGTPYDLDDGASFKRWAAGERGAVLWQAQANALSLAYDALDELLLSSAQWNYTAS